MQKFFNGVIITITILLSIFSVFAFLIIHLNLFQRNFKFNLEGLNNYFETLTQFKELFAATITLILAYYGLERLKTAEQANKEKAKMDRFIDWKSITEMRMAEIKNNLFKREFSKRRYNLYDDLYKNKMSIEKKEELEKIFNDHLEPIVQVSEEQDNTYVGTGGIYKDDNSAYFLDNFYFVFIGCLDKSYDNIYSDFKNLYLKNIDQDRIIDKRAYEAAMTRHTGLI